MYSGAFTTLLAQRPRLEVRIAQTIGSEGDGYEDEAEFY